MSHIKLISVPNSWRLKDLIYGLKQDYEWNLTEISNIKLIYLEQQNNNRHHVRMIFYDNQLINDIFSKKTRM